MPLRVFKQDDVRPELLSGRTVATVGYGNQGRAQALNLRDGGARVIIGQRTGSPRHAQALEDGFEVYDAAAATERADFVLMLVPDHLMAAVFAREVGPALREGSALVFSHGYAIHFGQITPPDGIDTILVAPKGIGHQVRAQYVAGHGVAVLVGVQKDATGSALNRAVALAGAIGRGIAGIYETTFRDETECDLFGEQAVLCGGVPELLRLSYETLVEAGYPPELAYFECIHELKLIADLIYSRGVSRMFNAISPTAAYGAFTRGPRVINEDTRTELRALLAEIRSGAFTKEFRKESEGGAPVRAASLERLAEHPSEETGRLIRGNMPWIRD